MRPAVVALALMALLTATGGPPAQAGGRLDRAARAEERSRVETTRICEGCGVSPRARSPTLTVASRNVRARSKRRAASLSVAVPALPPISRAELQVQVLNALAAQQQQRVQFQQQIQFELNQLRYELQRDRLFR